jgi:hypothetical protein
VSAQRLLAAGLVALALGLVAPALAGAHGAEEKAPASAEPAPGQTAEEAAEEAEVAALAEQPARVLAQQAMALLQVRGDEHEAGVRLDAALISKDRDDVDIETLRQATETFDGGDPEGAVPLIDAALSRPLGAKSGKALHEAERSFSPAKGTQEVVGVVAGAAFLVLGALALALARARHRRAAGVQG